MSYSATGHGAFTVPNAVDVADVSATITGIDKDRAPTFEALLNQVGFVDAYSHVPHPSEGQTWAVTFDGKVSHVTQAVLERLAASGVTGQMHFDDQHASRWLTVLAGGKVTEYPAITVYVGDPTPDYPILALTRAEARAVLELATGETPTNLDAVVTKVSEALRH